MSDTEFLRHASGRAPLGKVFVECHAANGSHAPNKLQAPLPHKRSAGYQNTSMTETLHTALGRRLKEARKRARLTQDNVGERLDLSSHSAIGQWERGIRLPSLLNLIFVAELYPASLDWLIWDMGNNIDARVKKLPAILRMPLIERLTREIEDAERLAGRLPKGFSGDPVIDEDAKLKQWSASEKLRQLRDRQQKEESKEPRTSAAKAPKQPKGPRPQ